MQRLASFARSTVVIAGLVGVSVSSAGAQQQAAGGWQGWVGCWTAAPAIGGIAPAAPAAAPLVCVAPTPDASVVDVSTIAGGSVLSTQRIDASGREQTLASNGCTGTHRAQWSADGRRVYLTAVSKCAGVERVTSGIIAMSSAGEWLDVQGVVTGSDTSVRVGRYRDAGVPGDVPQGIAAALRQRGWANQGARLALGGTIGTSAVIDASRLVTPAVVEAWLLERGQIFPLDSRELVRLADAGVPARVTDAMVVVSNPEKFAVARADEGAQSGGRNSEDEITGRRIYATMNPMGSPYGWGYAPYGYGNGYGYGPYGYSPLGYGGYGRGYGYSGYPGYRAPIVVLNGQGQTRGQAVKGRGYTQSEPNTASPAGPRRSQGSSGSAGRSSGSAPSSSGSARRTAKPRP